jgi:hypothetical protein
MTHVVALLGHPVAHSLSPRMHNAAFAVRGLDWTYVALDVEPDRLEEAVRGYGRSMSVCPARSSNSTSSRTGVAWITTSASATSGGHIVRRE